MNELPALTTVRRTALTPAPIAAQTAAPGAAPAGALIATPGPVGGRTPPRPTPGLPADRPPAEVEVPGLPPAGRRFLGELVHAGLLSADALPDFFAKVGPRVHQLTTRDRAADALVGLHVLTRYVATRAVAGQYHGLVFGGYRVLDRLSSGSVGVVFRAEHRVLRRMAAVKAVNLVPDLHPEVVARFFREVRVLSKIDHPHVVAVHDAGRLPEVGRRAGHGRTS